MFRTSYVHLQEDYTVHTALYGMFSTLKLQYKATQISKYQIVSTQNTDNSVKYGGFWSVIKVFKTR
jgi:hypothetical protein